MTEQPLVIVSKSEPEDADARLGSYGLNAVRGEAGTDYVWYPHTKTFGIERKTVTNLLQSLKDRQLVEQAHRGVKAFDRYFLLIEGQYREGKTGQFEFYTPRHPEAGTDGWVTSGWRYDAIEGMLLELNLLGVFILTCPLYEYPRKIAGVVNNTSAPEKQFIREQMRPILPPEAAMGGELYTDALWALCALDGCGPKIAEALLHEYGTLAEVVLMLSVGNGTTVKVGNKRVGKKTIQRLQDAVNAPFR